MSLTSAGALKADVDPLREVAREARGIPFSGSNDVKQMAVLFESGHATADAPAYQVFLQLREKFVGDLGGLAHLPADVACPSRCNHKRPASGIPRNPRLVIMRSKICGRLSHARPPFISLLLLGNDASNHLLRDWTAVIAELGAVFHPLPHLRAANFRGGGVFHQVVDRNAAVTAQPRFQILQSDVDIPAQAFLGDLAFGDGEQILRR